MKAIYYILTYVCYAIGHPISVLTNFMARVSPDDDAVINFLYTVYSKFLNWSADFDKAEWLWLHRHENETEEEFNQRCKTRWPDMEEL
jgi:hypothetical protein